MHQTRRLPLHSRNKQSQRANPPQHQERYLLSHTLIRAQYPNYIKKPNYPIAKQTTLLKGDRKGWRERAGELSGYGRLLVLPRTGVQFPASMWGGSQLPITPVPRDLMPFSGFSVHLHGCGVHKYSQACAHTHTQAHSCTHIKVMNKYIFYKIYLKRRS